MNIELTEKEQKEVLKSALKEVIINKLHENSWIETVIELITDNQIKIAVKELFKEPESQDRIKKAVKDSIDYTLTEIAKDPFNYADYDIVQPLVKQLVNAIKNTEIVFKQKGD